MVIRFRSQISRKGDLSMVIFYCALAAFALIAIGLFCRTMEQENRQGLTHAERMRLEYWGASGSRKKDEE